MPRTANPANRSCFREYAGNAGEGRDPGNLRPRAVSCGSDRRCSDSSLDGLPKGRGRGGAVKRPARGEKSGAPAGTRPGEERADPDPPRVTLHEEPTSKRPLGKEHRVHDDWSLGPWRGPATAGSDERYGRPVSDDLVGTPVAPVAGEGSVLLEVALFLAAELLFGGNQVGDVQTMGRPLGQCPGPGIDAGAILKTIEPASGYLSNSVVCTREGTQDGSCGVRVATQIDDLGERLLEAVGREQEVKAGRDASRREAHRRALARGFGTVPVGFLDHGCQGTFA